MNKIIIILFILVGSLADAQLITQPKSVNLEIGVGAISPRIYNNVYVGNGSQSFATLFETQLNFKVDRLTYGVKFNLYKFATENDTTVRSASATGGALQLTTSYCFVEKEKFASYISTGIGIGGLNYDRYVTTNLNGSVNMSGFSSHFGLGFRYHFSKAFGFFMHTSFNYFTFVMDNFQVNGNNQDEFENRPINEVIFTFRGIDLKLGLRLSFSKKAEPKKVNANF